mmetsp:Transcript_26920/g.41230  ORF Transcript_26920/g.41230 Transcript_26920/m.41230 type:complete len:250 (-) Transcript_26920:163-912(-)
MIFSQSSMSLLSLLLVPSAVFASQHHYSSTLHVCNRGFCYTKKEDWRRQQRPLYSTSATASEQGNTKGGSFNFCTDSHGNPLDCELFEILNMDQYDAIYEEENEALECRQGDPCETSVKQGPTEKPPVFYYYTEKILELDEEGDSIKHGHISWKERPQKGKCYDQYSKQPFDCNLIEVLPEGLMLIEMISPPHAKVMLRRPQTDFTTRKSPSEKYHRQQPRTPDVLNGSGAADPAQDWRTNVILNLEGL